MVILKKIFKTFKSIFRRRQRAGKKRKISKRIFRSSKRKRKVEKKRVFKARRKITKPSSFIAKKLFFKKPHPSSEKIEKQNKEILVGDVTHYFSRIMVCVVKMTGSPMNIGDRIRIKGNTRNFVQEVRSLQIESMDVKSARRGQLVGLKVKQVARAGDKVYKIN